MKKITFFLVLFSLTGLINVPVSVGDIYISEFCLDHAGNSGTLFSIFDNDGNKLNELFLNGTLPRVSPTKQNIAYVSQPSPTADEVWDIAIREVSGTKERLLNFLRQQERNNILVGAPEWSPDGKKLAILITSRGMVINKDFRGHITTLFVYDIDASSYKPVYGFPTESADAVYGAKVKWLPDNQRILLQEKSTCIIDTQTREAVTVLDKPSIFTHLINSGQDVIVVTPGAFSSQDKNKSVKTVTVNKYNIASEKIEQITELAMFPNIVTEFSIYDDNAEKMLVTEDKGDDITHCVVVYPNKEKAEKEEYEFTAFIPKLFSPQKNNSLLGVDKDGYVLLDMETKVKNKLKDYSADTPKGEALFSTIFFNNIEWR